jgi:hypothetical protein
LLDTRKLTGAWKPATAGSEVKPEYLLPGFGCAASASAATANVSSVAAAATDTRRVLR